MGSRQLFVRFYGCNLECVYCDTFRGSYKTFTREALLSKVLDLGEDYNELVITGGEPLMFSGFLKEFLSLFRKYSKHRVYLETNGTLADGLSEISALVDIISMDFKLPSSSGAPETIWEDHKLFMERCGGKELIVKAVITGETTIDDIKKMSSLLVMPGPDKNLVTILQPVSPEEKKVSLADDEMMIFFREYLKKETGRDVVILGQMHKYAGIR